jgi:hypothetical protein
MNKFFIVGCPRSGTTMLQQALNRHSQIAIPAETKFFFSFFGHPLKSQIHHVERLNRDLSIQLPRPTARIASAEDGRAFYDLMAQRYIERLPKKDVAYFGEKTPEHTGHLPGIQRLFPEARIIVLCRDGRDVASSLTRMPWMTHSLYANFVVWLYYHRVIQRMKESAPANVYFARYEDIVADPRRGLTGVLNFLGLPYEPAVAEGHGNKEGIPPREYAWKARALRKISTERIGVFRQELSAQQIEVLERLGKLALSSLGYPLLSDGDRPLPLSFFIKLAYDLGRFALRLPWHAILREMVCRLVLDGRPAPVPVPNAPLTPALV